MKSLKIETLLTERYKDEHHEVFAKMTNRVRILHEKEDGTRCVKLHGSWWKVYRCLGGHEWSRSYLGEKLDDE